MPCHSLSVLRVGPAEGPYEPDRWPPAHRHAPYAKGRPTPLCGRSIRGTYIRVSSPRIPVTDAAPVKPGPGHRIAAGDLESVARRVRACLRPQLPPIPGGFKLAWADESLPGQRYILKTATPTARLLSLPSLRPGWELPAIKPSALAAGLSDTYTQPDSSSAQPHLPVAGPHLPKKRSAAPRTWPNLEQPDHRRVRLPHVHRSPLVLKYDCSLPAACPPCRWPRL